MRRAGASAAAGDSELHTMFGAPISPSSRQLVHDPATPLCGAATSGSPPDDLRVQGRMIASCCSHLDLQHLRSLNQGGKLKLAQGRLQEPDVQWTLVVVRDFGGDKASVRLANVKGRGLGQVRFAGRVDTESTFGAATHGTMRNVGPDGLVDELTNFLAPASPYGSHGQAQQSKMQVHIAVYRNETSNEGQQGDDLSADLAKLLEQGVLSDVVLQAGGAKAKVDLRAHKAVLAARSPVFQRLLMSDMVESRTSTVAVDFPAPIMELVLRYAYTGRVDLGAEDAKAGEQAGEGEAVTAMALLAAADYYQLSGLKRQCEERLLQRVALVPEEVLQTVVLADRYGARALKEAALDVAADYLKPLRQRPEWDDFARQNHDLVAELMGVLADKLEQAQQAVLKGQQQHQSLVRQGGAGGAQYLPPRMAPQCSLGLGHYGGDVFGQILIRPNRRESRDESILLW
ncbi:uncharacterized protein LOC113209465 [Frankliniella occidentalis]|uniref:Uncharacterized protein LOC113209465 n=1 Tax=Frankliniella occidentalis TaxID=133901 RepID=A0A9C6XB60_FRAOC|nr:uncharacterized protein LOC113209465 [Frankliniella occidentalis]